MESYFSDFQYFSRSHQSRSSYRLKIFYFVAKLTKFSTNQTKKTFQSQKCFVNGYEVVKMAERPTTTNISILVFRYNKPLLLPSKMSSGNASIGAQAPDFSTTAVVNGDFTENFSMSQFKGKYVVLFFYPLDFTFVCPTEICAFSDRANEFKELGCEVKKVGNILKLVFLKKSFF